VEKGRCNVFVSSLEEAGKLIEEHEISSRTRFACYKKTKDFGNQGKDIVVKSIICRLNFFQI
jgi:archaeosine-15-forming tRNA-guanine transglycosylase